ncbi:hypothetical protein Tco_0520985, partial [Tanacetum coccineum]
MTLKDFLHFPGNRSASFSARPTDVPMSIVARPVGSPWRVIASSSDVDQKGKRVTFKNSAGSPSFKKRKHVVLDEGPSSLKFVPDIAPSDEACIEEARSSRDALCNLSYPDVQRRLDGLTLTELTNFHDVAAVRFVMSNNLLTREAEALSAEVFRLRGEVEALKDKLDLANQEQTSLVRDFFPHAVERLLSSDHLSSALADLQEKAMLIGRSQALREVASSGIGVELVDMKDFDPNAEQNYDRAIESFYQVKFPYADLLVHYAGQSVGMLMNLKPPIIPFENAFAAGPSASPFLLFSHCYFMSLCDVALLLRFSDTLLFLWSDSVPLFSVPACPFGQYLLPCWVFAYPETYV